MRHRPKPEPFAPFYLIIAEYSGKPLIYEHMPHETLEPVIEDIATGEVEDVLWVLRVDAASGTTEDVTEKVAEKLADRSFDKCAEPSASVEALLNRFRFDFYNPQPHQRALNHWFIQSGRGL
jgi:hypothetical protein